MQAEGMGHRALGHTGTHGAQERQRVLVAGTDIVEDKGTWDRVWGHVTAVLSLHTNPSVVHLFGLTCHCGHLKLS